MKPILMYHKVAPAFEWGLTTIHPKTFERQMAFLAEKGFRGTTIRNLLTNGRDGDFAISFDDAYENVYEYAFPILQKLGFTATIFAIGDYIGQMNDWDANIGGIHFRHMSEKQIQEVVNAGWELGSHGMTHDAFVRKTATQLDYEMHKSKTDFEEIYSTKVSYIAFPFGYYNQNLMELCQKSGYEGGIAFADNYSNSAVPIYGRYGVYRWIDSRLDVLAKIDHHNRAMTKYQEFKGRFIHLGASLTILYQLLFQR